MAEHAQTLEEELAQRGIVSSYIWKPNRLFAKSGNRYVPADVVSDGSAADVSEAVAEAGRNQISSIEALAAAQKALISANERDYRRMYNYFTNQGLIALATIMATAIVNLNTL